ncbi:MAG TPA: response regulator [Candidatus Limnocylindrales bacterium]|nr:response regulator [Candidatus Limnocylindrales bacterium]
MSDRNGGVRAVDAAGGVDDFNGFGGFDVEGHAAPAHLGHAVHAGPGHILVVDDSRMNRMTLIRLLQRLGHESLEAADGREALDLLATGAPVDLVLLDLVMPEVDGFETLETMKADPRLAHIPVIVVSGLDDLDGIVRCIEMGAVDYLPRPIKPTLLQARVEATLADKRLRDDNAKLLQTVERQRTELARFLSPRVAELVSSPEGEALLAGHRSELTVVFADLRGFTAFCEVADPEEIVRVLREYHAVVGHRVTEFEATLEHYAGDGVHVFFNDPVPQADHRYRAVRMTVALRDDVAQLQERWAARGTHLGFGVGISVGSATTGRIGFEGRYAYAALGAVVNLAARLSAHALDGQILITDELYRDVRDCLEVESVWALHLKGISHEVTAWNVVRLLD